MEHPVLRAADSVSIADKVTYGFACSAPIVFFTALRCLRSRKTIKEVMITLMAMVHEK